MRVYLGGLKKPFGCKEKEKKKAKMEEAEQAYRNALYYRRNMADMLYNL